MPHHIRALAVVVILLALAAGCARATGAPRVSRTSPTDGAAAPIPGHPPVTTTGEVASVDTSNGVVTSRTVAR